jgi:hypothetical protein
MHNASSIINKKTNMKRLPETLKRKGITYRMISRTDKFVLWEQFINGNRVGFEVSAIQILPEQKLHGSFLSAREALPPDSRFGVMDKSRCFFPDEPQRAKEYYQKTSIEINISELDKSRKHVKRVA